MKKGWQTKELGEICEIERGGSPRPIDSFLTKDSNGINWIKIGDTKNVTKYITQTKEKIRPEGAQRSRIVYEGDFILSNSMSFGRPYIMKITGCIHDGWLVLRQPKIDQDYLYYVLSSDLVFNQFDRLAAGSTVRNLNIGLAKTVKIPYPPLLEQRRIVGILDEAFNGIAAAKVNGEKNLQNARALFESHLQSVFTKGGKGWEEKPLGDIATFRNGINYTKSSKGERVKIVGVKDFKSNFWVPVDNLDTVTLEGKLDGSDTLKRDDILAVRSNGNIDLIGRTLLAGDMPEKTSHSGFTIRIRLSNEDVLSRYLCHFMKCTASRKQLVAGGTGTNIKSLNQQTLSRLVVPFPPRLQQQSLIAEFESFSAETRRLEFIYCRKLVALEALKRSLLHRAFSGEM